jgi:hypothetical protein
MKKSLVLLSFLLILLRGFTTAQNPYESLGKVAPVLTLSNGKYQEFMTNDTIVQIGSVMFNTITNEVVSFLEEDSLRLMEADLTTRFLSVDPIGRQFPELTPYQFASNMPIAAIDLDGEEAKLIITTEITGYTMANAYSSNKSHPSLKIVPTYKMILIDASDPTTVIATYNVTRDAYYNKVNSEGREVQINRAFEPAKPEEPVGPSDEEHHLYDGYKRQYPRKPTTDLSALKLTESGNDVDIPLKAKPFSQDENTDIEQPRKNLGEA